MNADGFILVSKRKRAKPRTLKPEESASTGTLTQETVESCYDKIQSSKEKLMLSKGFQDFKVNLSRIELHLKDQTRIETQSKISHIVCYGLGLPSCQRIAQYQTGLLVLLRDYFNVDVEVYDPLFTNIDIEVLKKLEFSILEKNEEGKRKITRPTLFYMPHCGKGLYNNLLWTNWYPEYLSNCVIIGNSFNTIVLNTPGRLMRKYFEYILKATDFFYEYPLEQIVKEENIFNDMSIHVVKKELIISELEQDFWDVGISPEYECDPEFVQSKS